MNALPLGNVESIMLSVEDYLPGDYNLTIEARDSFGRSITEVVTVFISGEFVTAKLGNLSFT